MQVNACRSRSHGAWATVAGLRVDGYRLVCFAGSRRQWGCYRPFARHEDRVALLRDVKWAGTGRLTGHGQRRGSVGWLGQVLHSAGSERSEARLGGGMQNKCCERMSVAQQRASLYMRRTVEDTRIFSERRTNNHQNVSTSCDSGTVYGQEKVNRKTSVSQPDMTCDQQSQRFAWAPFSC